ncbi:7978_t:CDS:2, partial [Acaulospora morrowiae]
TEKSVNSRLSSPAIYLPGPKSHFSLKPKSVLETGDPPKKDPEKDCPPCFNCQLSAFPCSHFSECNIYDGKCECPPGFGGNDCSVPVCNSLADGRNRLPREVNQTCQCTEGWGGINCNVCLTDSVCDPLVPTRSNGTCYKGGLTVHENFQMCNVTNKKILDMLPNQPPQVTFSFWINQTESFYCHLTNCSFYQDINSEQNTTEYKCDKIKCQCMAGEMLCGKDGSIDLSEWLIEEINGPAEFSCYGSSDCRFSEPAMDQLILSIFGDKYISLDCFGGECLHISEVPKPDRPHKPDNTNIIIAAIIAVFTFVAGIFAAVFYLSRHWSPSSYGQI